MFPQKMKEKKATFGDVERQPHQADLVEGRAGYICIFLPGCRAFSAKTEMVPGTSGWVITLVHIIEL